MHIPDFTKVERQLLIASSGLTFSIFALIYREEYVSVGLITFAYGVVAWFLDTCIWQLRGKKPDRLTLGLLFTANFILAGIWIGLVWCVYPR